MTQTLRERNGSIAMRVTTALALLIVSLPIQAQNERTAPSPPNSTRVLFMCPHGAAKSVLASTSLPPAREGARPQCHRRVGWHRA